MEIALNFILAILGLILLGITLFFARFLFFFIVRLAIGGALVMMGLSFIGFHVSWTTFFIGCGATLIYYWYKGELGELIEKVFADSRSSRSSSSTSSSTPTPTPDKSLCQYYENGCCRLYNLKGSWGDPHLCPCDGDNKYWLCHKKGYYK